MDIVIQILQLLWIAGISIASVLVAVDIMTVDSKKRDPSKVHSRMKTALGALVFGIVAKIAKFFS